MPRYFLSMRLLPAEFYPCRVLRTDAVTLQILDPRATALEGHAATVDLLEPWEYAAARVAYGQPPPGLPVDDELMDGMLMPFVPAAIRVPGEPPVQAVRYDTVGYLCAYGRAVAWAISERWGDLGPRMYEHPLTYRLRQGAA